MRAFLVVLLTAAAAAVAACAPDFDSLFVDGPKELTSDDAGGGGPRPVDAGTDVKRPDEKPDASSLEDSGGGPLIGDGKMCVQGNDCNTGFACTGASCKYACDGCGCTCPRRTCTTTGATPLEKCESACAPGTLCDVVCEAPTCVLASHGAQGALLTCANGTKDCNTTCDQGGDCDLLCDTETAGATCKLRCSGGAKCHIQCPHTSSCELECIGGVARTCPDGSKACDHPCP